MAAFVKVSTFFVILLCIISVSTLNIRKSKRIIQQPLRVLAPPVINNSSSENKYLSLSATFDIEEDDESPIISAEQVNYNVKEEEPVPDNSAEQIIGLNKEKNLAGKSSEHTYNSDYDKQVVSTEYSDLAYNIEKDESVDSKSDEAYNVNNDEKIVTAKSLGQTYNIEKYEEESNTGSEPTYYRAKEYAQANNKNSDDNYNIREDDKVLNKKNEKYNTENYSETPNLSFKQTYKQDKEIPNKIFAQTESPRSFNNNHGSTKAPKTFSKRTKEATTVVPIIENENYVFAYNGDYHYSYKGADGTQAFERGERKAAKQGAAEDVVVGGYSYKDKDGNDFSLTYTAGENGYRPVGAHLPTPPPIPPAIQRVLRILATKTTPEPESVTESLNNYDYN